MDHFCWTNKDIIIIKDSDGNVSGVIAHIIVSYYGYYVIH